MFGLDLIIYITSNSQMFFLHKLLETHIKGAQTHTHTPMGCKLLMLQLEKQKMCFVLIEVRQLGMLGI